MTDLRAPGSRAVLIGASTYASDGLTDIPAIVDTVNDLRLALINQCGMARESIRSLLDWSEARDVESELAREAQNAQGILIVYYVGHGLVGPHGELYLAVGRTDPAPGRRGYTAISCERIFRELGDSPAGAIVVIIDCCFSAWALTPDGRADRGLAVPPGREGGLVITSAAREEQAIAPPGERYTAFTGELLKLLKDGDLDGRAELTLRDTCRYLRDTLEARRLPRPLWAFAGIADQIVLAANPAYRPRPAGEAAAGPAILDPPPANPPQVPSRPAPAPSGPAPASAAGDPPAASSSATSIPPQAGGSRRSVRNRRALAAAGGAAAVLVVLALVIILVLPGPSGPDKHQPACATGTLTLVGSTAFAPLALVAAGAYDADCAGAHITVNAQDSASGLTMLSKATAQNPGKADLRNAIGYAGYAEFAGYRVMYPHVQVVNIGDVAPTAQHIKNGSYSFWVVEHLYTTRQPAAITADFLSFLSHYLASNPQDGFLACPAVPKSLGTDC